MYVMKNAMTAVGLLMLTLLASGRAASGCPAGVPMVKCFADPCSVAPRCTAYPKAQCKANYCGGCFAEYYEQGTKVDCAKPRFCAIGPKDQIKCQRWATAMASNFTCVNGVNAKDCYTKIAEGQADMSLFGGADIFLAGETYGLVAIAYEQHRSNKSGTYTNNYAVAVVRKGSHLTLDKLKSSKSCHTGYGDNAGWKVPMGYLLRKGNMSWVNCDQFATAAAFFKQSCVPGARGKEPNLCSLCKGKGKNKCAENSKEPYQKHKGALKCLNETAGDVAFLKASVVIASTNPSHFRLLCRNLSQAEPKEFKTCYLAKSPARAFLARKDDTKIPVYVALLEESSKKFGYNTSRSFKLFDNKGIFSSSAGSLKEVATKYRSYDKYLEYNYMKDVSKLENCSASGTLSLTANASGTSFLINTLVFMVISFKMLI